MALNYFLSSCFVSVASLNLAVFRSQPVRENASDSWISFQPDPVTELTWSRRQRVAVDLFNVHPPPKDDFEASAWLC